MSAQFARAPHRGNPAPTLQQPPHAALLIDFDNVTMGIRSDLSKELKNLLSSDFIKGKVAVQRAYADWRRYPQYIVPLAESSVDLIFAPAYGSSKKNATDIRLAIDALELVFTRPEIGTFILLSGDSDFSSLVLKLKEYGKYVVGVGIRESASDLLVQNCDEYYSYSALTGLTRAGDEAATTAEDPWELVEMAIKQMVENDDVMRSDRLKQVILEMDPSFDEKALGFQKFNRFMQEAASRGLVSLRKLENGQFEVGPPGAHPATEAESEEEEQRGNGRRRSRRGRGRDREPRREREEARARPAEDSAIEEAAAATGDATPSAAARSPAPSVEAAPEAVPSRSAAVPVDPARLVPAQARATPAGPRSRASAPHAAPPAPELDGAREAGAEPAATAPAHVTRGEARLVPAGNLRASYDLLRRAVTDVTGRSGEAARDSDVKRRMLELQEGWDEAAIGFSKFSRFLRQAHDAEVINLRKLESGAYEVELEERGRTASGVGRPRRERGRGRERAADTVSSRPAEEAPEGATQATRRAPDRPRRGRPQEELPLSQATGPAAAATRAPAPSSPVPPPAAAPAPTPGTGSGAARTLGIRRGSRGRVPSAPPPLLEGQTVARAPAPAAPVAPGKAVDATREPAAEPETPARAARTRTRRSEPAAAPTKAARAVGGQPDVAQSDASAAAPLPRDAAGVVGYLTGFKGVGPKSVQALVEALGPTRVFQALEKQPDRIREIVPGARGERLLEAWREDTARRGGGAAAETEPARRTRRGGRKRGAAKPRA